MNNVFFNALSKSLEYKLLDYDKCLQLCQCKNLNEIIKKLNNWEKLKIEVKTFEDLDKLVILEEKEFIQFLISYTPNPKISDFFLIKYDYFNLEVEYLKNKMNLNLSNYLEGRIKISSIDKCLKSHNYTALDLPMQECLNYLDNKKELTTFLIDTKFKKSLYHQMLDLSKKDKILYQYMLMFIDIKNIELALKFKDKDFFDLIFLEGGRLERKFFDELINSSLQEFLNKNKTSPYYLAISLLDKDVNNMDSNYNYEKMLDTLCLTIAQKQKYDSFGVSPYIRYCLLKQIELLNMKIIFNGFKVNMSKKKIINQLRRVNE